LRRRQAGVGPDSEGEIPTHTSRWDAQFPAFIWAECAVGGPLSDDDMDAILQRNIYDDEFK
jgi:hypothetical protein